MRATTAVCSLSRWRTWCFANIRGQQFSSGDVPRLHATLVTFTPPNKRGAVVTLIASYEWSFDIDVGRFKLFDTEPMRDSETLHVALVAETHRVARNGLPRGSLDRLIAFGRDRVEL